MTDDPVFVRLSPGSRVHVIEDGRPPALHARWLNPEVTKSWVIAFGYIGTTYCGHNATMVRRSFVTNMFYDDDLCHHCYQLWPGPKRHLFDHPVPPHV